MPSEDFFPDKLKELSLKNAPEFNFSFFEVYRLHNPITEWDGDRWEERRNKLLNVSKKGNRIDNLQKSRN